MDKDSVRPVYILLIPLGFIIWSLAFVTLYATNAIGCAFGWDQSVQRAVLVGISLAFLGVSGVCAMLVLGFRNRRARHGPPPAPSLAQLGIYGACSAFVSVIAIAIPGFAASMCL